MRMKLIRANGWLKSNIILWNEFISWRRFSELPQPNHPFLLICGGLISQMRWLLNRMKLLMVQKLMVHCGTSNCAIIVNSIVKYDYEPGWESVIFRRNMTEFYFKPQHGRFRVPFDNHFLPPCNWCWPLTRDGEKRVHVSLPRGSALIVPAARSKLKLWPRRLSRSQDLSSGAEMYYVPIVDQS